MNQSIQELLGNTAVEASPEVFTLISITKEAWPKLLEDHALSPRGSAPFMIFMDKHEVTLLPDEIDFKTISHAVRERKKLAYGGAISLVVKMSKTTEAISGEPQTTFPGRGRD